MILDRIGKDWGRIGMILCGIEMILDRIKKD
jgi:hypothetical protein